MTVALVQAKTATAFSTGDSATLDAAATAGNLLVWVVAGDKNTGAMTMVGWSPDVELISASVCLYVRTKVAAGGETTISATHANSSAGGCTVWVGEYADLDVDGATWEIVDKATNITNEASVTSKATGTTGALAHGGLAIAACAVDSSNGSPTYGWSDSYTPRLTPGTATGAPAPLAIAEKTVTAGTTTGPTCTLLTGSADQMSAAVIVVRKVAASGAVELGQAEAVELAQPITPAKRLAVAAAAELGTARPVGRAKTAIVGAAVELSEAAAVTAQLLTRVVVGQAVERGYVWGFDPPGGYGVDPYGECPYGSPAEGARVKVRAVGQAVELDRAARVRSTGDPVPPTILVAAHRAAGALDAQHSATLAAGRGRTRLEARHG